MIDKNLIVEYLEPTLWGRLGEIMEILRPARKVAHILEGKDGCRAVFDGAVFFRTEMENGERPETWFPGADEIRIYSPQTIDDFFRAIQRRELYALDIDDYLREMDEELSRRISVISRKEKTDYLWKILERFAGTDGVYNIGIMHKENLYFQCMLEFRGGRLTRVTSADRYGKDVFDWEKICENVRNEFSGGCIHIMMTLEELRAKVGGYRTEIPGRRLYDWKTEL